MQIVDIPENTNLIFELVLNNEKFEFPSKFVSKDKNNSILAEPVRINGKVLGFNTEQKVSINLIMIRQDKAPVVWKGVGVGTVMFKGNTYYRVTASGPGFEMNRRGAFRMFIGCKGIAQMGINRKADEVIVKDISETGYSFVSTENYENMEGAPIRLVFSDLNRNFSLMGILVRKVVLDPTKILYGCQLSSPNAMLQQFISEKQRQMLALSRGNNFAAREKEMLQSALKEPSIADSRKEEEDDVNYKKKSIKNDGTRKARELDTVGKTERRDIFKDEY